MLKLGSFVPRLPLNLSYFSLNSHLRGSARFTRETRSLCSCALVLGKIQDGITYIIPTRKPQSSSRVGYLEKFQLPENSYEINFAVGRKNMRDSHVTPIDHFIAAWFAAKHQMACSYLIPTQKLQPMCRVGNLEK